MPSSHPEDLLNRPLLRQLAGDNSFARGEEYFTNGRVRQLHVTGDRVTARVSGSRTYRVKLWRGRGKLHFSCNCAVGREETFCKHCVAVGLAWLAGPDGQPIAVSDAERQGAEDASRQASREQLQRHLRVLDKDRLISLVLEATDYDDILRRRLLLETIGVLRPANPRRTSTPAPAPDLDAYRQLLRESIECPEYVDYDAMPDYAQGIEEAIYPMGELLASGHAAAVIELAEFALIELDKANEMIDGGDGSLNPVYDDLQHYHLEACRTAQPDPVKLASRLLHYELEGGLGVFNNAAKAYADVLGPRGLAAWRNALVREWTQLPALAADRPAAPPEPINYRRFQVQALMERLAANGGDLATQAAVKQRDLSSPHDFLSLAELFQAAGQSDQALTWAERGLQAFPELPDRVGLRDFVAAAYHRQGRHDEAVQLAWQEFARFSDLEHYRKLHHHAGQASDWPGWRQRALAHLRTEGNQEREVEILLADGDIEAAWWAADEDGCSRETWLKLAEKGERTHPGDAAIIYMKQVDAWLIAGEPERLADAARLVRRVGALLRGLGRDDEFEHYAAKLRADHPEKRAFLKRLNTPDA